jgi:hypothetical protein
LQDLSAQKLVWAIMKAQSEDEIGRLVSAWHRSAEEDPELRAAMLEPHIAGSNFQAAREALESRFGRHHPRHKPAMDVLVAAAQSQRMLRLRLAQNIMDDARARNAKGTSF